MNTDRKKPGVTFWATLVVVALVLYVLSFGPACWLCAHDVLPVRATSIAYWPLLVEARREFLGDKPARWMPVLWWTSVWDRPVHSFLGMDGLGKLLDQMK